MAENREMRILTIGAHAADQELSAGMVVAKYTRAGHKAFMLSLTPGEKGHATLTAEQYAEQKRREAAECCRKLGAEAIVLGYKDAELPYNDAVAYEVCDIIRDIKPDIIITHWENSIHKDHRHAHKIAMDAWFYAALKRIERAKPAHWTRKVYFSENWEDMEGYEPDLHVNIPEEVFEQYADALSSFALWNGGTGWPYADYYKSLARMRGCLGGGLTWKYAATLKVPKGALVQRFGGEDLPFAL